MGMTGTRQGQAYMWRCVLLFTLVVAYVSGASQTINPSTSLHTVLKDWISGDELTLESGVYLVSSPIELTANISIRAAPGAAVGIHKSGDPTIFYVSNPNVKAQFSNLRFKGDGSSECALKEPLALDVDSNVDITKPEIGDNDLIFEADFGIWHNHRWLEDFEYGECTLSNDYKSSGIQAINKYRFSLQANCHGQLKYWFDFTKMENCGIMGTLKPTAVAYDGVMKAHFREDLYYQNALELLMVPLNRHSTAQTSLCVVVSRVEKICLAVTVNQPRVVSLGNICGRTHLDDGVTPVTDMLIELESVGTDTLVMLEVEVDETNGTYCFKNLKEGVTYVITATDPTTGEISKQNLTIIMDYDSPTGGPQDGIATVPNLSGNVTNVDFVYTKDTDDIIVPPCADVQGSVKQLLPGHVEENLKVFPMVPVKIVDVNGTTVGETTTDEIGQYSFGCVEFGDYQIIVPEVAVNASDVTLDLVTEPVSDGEDIDGIYSFTLDSSTMADPIEPFVFAPLSSISGTVMTEDGEKLFGVVVSVYDSNNQTVVSIYTKEDGTYSVGDLPDGDYKVIVQTNDGVVIEYDIVGEDLLEATITDRVPVSGIDFVFKLPGSISGHTLEKIGNVTIPGTLIRLEGITDPSFTKQTSTDENAYYEFTGLPKGQYRVIAPTTINSVGDLVTFPADEFADPNGSDVPEESTHEIKVGHLNITDVDFLYKGPGSISGYTLTEEGDIPIPGLNCTLTSTSDPSIPAQVQTTNIDGFYQFSGLEDDIYKVTCPKEAETVGPISSGPSDNNGEKYDHVAAIDDNTRNVTDVTFKYLPYGSIKGSITNGILEPGSDGINNVVCILTKEGDASFELQVSSNPKNGVDGLFEVDGLVFGTYSLTCPEEIEEEGLDVSEGPNDIPIEDGNVFETTFVIGPDTPTRDDLDFVYLPPGTIAGGTYEEGSDRVPIPDVTVKLVFLDGSEPDREYITNSSGKYIFVDLPTGEYKVVAVETVGSVGPIVDGPVKGPLDNGETDIFVSVQAITEEVRAVTKVDFIYARPGSISGTISEDLPGDQFVAIPGVVCVLTGPELDGPLGAVTDTSGFFEFLNIGDGTYNLTCPTTALFTDGDNGTISQGPDGPNDELFEVTTITIGPDNRAVVNQDSEYLRLGVITGITQEEFTKAPIAGVTCTLRGADASEETYVTGADGRFEFKDLTYQQYMVSCPTVVSYLDKNHTISQGPDETVRDDDVLESTVTEIDAENRVVGDLIFEYLPLGTVSGKTFDTSDNSAIPGADCVLKGTDPDNLAYTRGMTTDSDGEYEFLDVPYGNYTVTCPTTVSNDREISFGPDDDEEPLNGTPVEISPESPISHNNDFGYTVPPTSTISGTTKTDSGAPLDNVYVELYNEEGDLLQTKVTGANGSPSGSFIFTNLPDGNYTVVVREKEFGVEEYELVEGYTVSLPAVIEDSVPVNDRDFVFTLPGKLSGHTLEKVSRVAILDLLVRLVGITDPSFERTTRTLDDTGFYEFTNLPRGEYKVIAPTTAPLTEIPGLGNMGTLVEYPLDGGLDEESEHAITADVPEIINIDYLYKQLGAISGSTVERADDTPIPGQECSLEKLMSDGSVDATFTKVTQFTDVDTGEYKFTSLADGRYTVTCPTVAESPDFSGPINSGVLCFQFEVGWFY
ncbi:hypothetical protein SARC_05548 [Sphaeroforma arctica JP610]|uniref:SD-repeat containing protein B domain-containing protein n=1 Tax=Sphaeroforma arctica JP610 TaxID=667725 RepID=A0A0L0FZB0_9EUKA|nr:hypothetical protein SARC_05548 [Sphaeroforma arctica JP610]KNC82167.1 hypothetical protein SARC_05548 [Sphaeroforma arctica JP610]|eukprot:XP_014156069.1 hypothetical protein SARC_05548 [Sphaeroforma arctica JP610]